MNPLLAIASDFYYAMETVEKQRATSPREAKVRSELMQALEHTNIFELVLRSELSGQKPKLTAIFKLLWLTKATRGYVINKFASLKSIKITYAGVEVDFGRFSYFTRRPTGWKLLRNLLRMNNEIGMKPSFLELSGSLAMRQDVRHHLLRLRTLKEISCGYFGNGYNPQVFIGSLTLRNEHTLTKVTGIPATSLNNFMRWVPARLRQAAFKLSVDTYVDYDHYGRPTLDKLVFGIEVTSDLGPAGGSIYAYHSTRIPATLQIAFSEAQIASRIVEFNLSIYSSADGRQWSEALTTLTSIKSLFPNVNCVNIDLRGESEFDLYSAYDSAALPTTICCDIREIQQNIDQLKQYLATRTVPGSLMTTYGVELHGSTDRVAKGITDYTAQISSAFPMLTYDCGRFNGIIEHEGTSINVKICVWSVNTEPESRESTRFREADDEQYQFPLRVAKPDVPWNITDEDIQQMLADNAVEAAQTASVADAASTAGHEKAISFPFELASFATSTIACGLSSTNPQPYRPRRHSATN